MDAEGIKFLLLQATITLEKAGAILGLILGLIALAGHINSRLKKPWEKPLLDLELSLNRKLDDCKKDEVSRTFEFQRGMDTKMADQGKAVEAKIEANNNRLRDVEKRADRLEINHAAVLDKIGEVKEMLKEKHAADKAQWDKIDDKIDDLSREILRRPTKDQ